MIRKHTMLYIIGFIGLLHGCGSDGDSVQESPVAFIRLDCPAVASGTSYQEPFFGVIENSHEYLERYLATNLDRQEDAPSVDFSTHQVIVLYAGQKPSLGHSIDVTSIVDDGDSVQVYYREGEPQTCGADAALSYPYCFVTVADLNKPVRFIGKVFNSCP